jgi:hypothetical protein
MKWEPPEGFTLNTGEMPPEAAGKRVRVILRHSREEPQYANETRSDLPPGWAADGKGGCRWTLKRAPFDIVAYRIL